MDPHTGPPPGLPRPKTSPPPPHTNFCNPLLPSHHVVASPVPQRASTASWASSLAAGLFPANFTSFPVPPQVPHELLPSNAAVQPAGCLRDNGQITDLGTGLPAPALTDPWHRAHTRVCAHATIPCAACSVALFCCTCRALRFTPGPPPASPSVPENAPRSPTHIQRYRSASPSLFRSDVGNGTPPQGFDSYNNDYDDDAYAQALADADTCDNSSCPKGPDAPAQYTITVEAFDEGAEELYNRTYRACAACNRACKKSFLGCRIKSRHFDNSARDNVKAKLDKDKNMTAAVTSDAHGTLAKSKTRLSPTCHANPVPGSELYALEHPTDNAPQTVPLPQGTPPAHHTSLNTPVNAPSDVISTLQDSLRELNRRPPTPAAFVAFTRVRHDAACTHQVDECSTCSGGLLCCFCKSLFKPAVARHLKCTNCRHLAHTCCTTCFCCQCSKPWTPSDISFPVRDALGTTPVRVPARRFYSGAGSDTGLNSSPEPDIWTPSPRSSPDEIDDLTVRTAIPLPTSRSESDASRAPSRASSVDEPVNVAATPLPTPNYSSISDDAVDGLIHPSFPDRAILDATDKRHFLGRSDLSVTSLKLYARRIFSETSHWITAGHFLVDIFQGSTLNGSRDDFRRFVILVGTQLGFGDLALSMSESLDVNRKMADEYMRLRDVATTWKQKAKANSKDAPRGSMEQSRGSHPFTTGRWKAGYGPAGSSHQNASSSQNRTSRTTLSPKRTALYRF
ncbi:hypothetical protein AX14_006532 [Amanita brunnescens Koide BX004]|nr:hypothetical protein AX14_006532 [Amanita brunnescens Koide BX004]